MRKLQILILAGVVGLATSGWSQCGLTLSVTCPATNQFSLGVSTTAGCYQDRRAANTVQWYYTNNGGTTWSTIGWMNWTTNATSTAMSWTQSVGQWVWGFRADVYNGAGTVIGSVNNPYAFQGTNPYSQPTNLVVMVGTNGIPIAVDGDLRTVVDMVAFFGGFMPGFLVWMAVAYLVKP